MVVLGIWKEDEGAAGKVSLLLRNLINFVAPRAGSNSQVYYGTGTLADMGSDSPHSHDEELYCFRRHAAAWKYVGTSVWEYTSIEWPV